MIFNLVQDFADLLDAIPREHSRFRNLKLFDEVICRDVHFIDRHRTKLFQSLWNSGWWYDRAEAAEHYVPYRPEATSEQLLQAVPSPHLLHRVGLAIACANSSCCDHEYRRHTRGPSLASSGPKTLRYSHPVVYLEVGNDSGLCVGTSVATSGTGVGTWPASGPARARSCLLYTSDAADE